MKFHMRNLQNSKKAQFFVLSAFAIVSIIYFVSRWMEPFTIIDTSSIPMMDEPFIFNNIVEKANETVGASKSCDDLTFNLQEYSNFVKDYASGRNMLLGFDYTQSACPANPAVVTFKINLTTTRIFINRTFSVTKSFS